MKVSEVSEGKWTRERAVSGRLWGAGGGSDTQCQVQQDQRECLQLPFPCPNTCASARREGLDPARERSEKGGRGRNGSKLTIDVMIGVYILSNRHGVGPDWCRQ